MKTEKKKIYQNKWVWLAVIWVLLIIYYGKSFKTTETRSQPLQQLSSKNIEQREEKTPYIKAGMYKVGFDIPEGGYSFPRRIIYSLFPNYKR